MMVFSCVPVFAEEATAPAATIPQGYEWVAENSRFNLYLKADTLALIVESKASGKLMYSTVQNPDDFKDVKTWKGFYQSGVVMRYIVDVQERLSQADFINEPSQVVVDKADNGFTAHVNFPNIGISYDMILTMDEQGFRVRIPQASIKETKEQPYIITVTEGGSHVRTNLQKYAKVEETTEYTVVDNKGDSYLVPKSIFVSSKGEQVTVRSSAGAGQIKLPQDRPIDEKLTLTDETGASVEVGADQIVSVKKQGSAYNVTDADGKTYTVPKEIVDKGTGAQVTVKLSDGSKLKLPQAQLNTEKLSLTGANGKTVEVGADTIVSMSKQDYMTGTKEDGSELKVKAETVHEVSATSYTVASFLVYPFLGSSTLAESEGYMIIPDGQGAIISLEDNEKRFNSPYLKTVYGTNIGTTDVLYSEDYVASEDVLMPVYGIVHTDDQIGFLGVIEGGDTAATIMAYPNGVTLSQNWVAGEVTYRMVYKQPMGSGTTGSVTTRTETQRKFDVGFRFLLEDGDTANYAGLAVAYRNYLEEKGTFKNADKRAFDVELDFLGMERENFVLGKQDVVMTSFEQAGEILTTLKSKGVEHMNVIYRGWQTNGLTGGLPTNSFDPAKSLGGANGLKALRERAALMGVELSLEADVLTLNPEAHPTLTYSAFKKITSQTFVKPSFGMVWGNQNYLTPTASRDAAARLTREMKDNGLKGISFRGITEIMADYYYKDTYHDSGELAAIYTQILADANDSFSTTLVNANAYLWPEADALSDLPIGGSDYTYTDAEIPFLAIALSGEIPCYAEYVNFQANSHEFLLHLLEQGVRPSFLLTFEDPIELQQTNSSDIYSSRYELYESIIVSWYRDLSELAEIVGPEGKIMNHVRQGDLACVTWDNGTRVYLNFGDNPGTMDGVSLEKLSYKIVRGGEQ